MPKSREPFAPSHAKSRYQRAFIFRTPPSRYYRGPVSDHFDGERFFDPLGVAPRSLASLLRWRLAGNGDPWPAWAPSPFRDHPPARIAGNRLRISFIGHASFLVQTCGMNILLDPVWSHRVSPFSFAGPKRVNEPGIPFADLPPIDVVLVSHGHYDHLDVETLSWLAATHHPRVITPLGNDVVMRSYDPAIAAEAFDWYQRVPIGPGMAVTPVPVQHWSARGLFDRNMTLWAGFVIETPGGHIYHVGDSAYGGGQRFRDAKERYGPFRLALLPIGAYAPRWFMRDYHMTPEEAVQAFRDCGAQYAFAHHYGTFKLSDEAIDAPPLALAAALEAAGIDDEQFRALLPGQVAELG